MQVIEAKIQQFLLHFSLIHSFLNVDLIYRSDFSSVICRRVAVRLLLEFLNWFHYRCGADGRAEMDLWYGIIYSCVCGQRNSCLWWSDTLRSVTAVASTGRISHFESTYLKGLLAVIALLTLTWPRLWGRFQANLHIVNELRGEHGVFLNISRNHFFSRPLAKIVIHYR